MKPQTQKTPESTNAVVIDAGKLLDMGAWNGYQKALTLLAALAVIFDGFDIQILGFAIPAIMREWHLTRAAFAPIAALGLAGMAVGSPVAGWCGDRFGRRTTLIGCVLVFGLATFTTAFCHSVAQLGFLRTMAGLGIGGALPNASALVAEFAPLRRRALGVSLTVMCIPLGGMVGGLVAGRILPGLGWHVLYMIGGAAPLLFAGVMLAGLAESPRYLARHPEKHAVLARELSKMGHIVPAGTVFVTMPEQETKSAGSIRSLFSPELRINTLGLWLAFFASLNGVYLVFSWLPAMLTAQGLDLGTASSALAAYNFGGVFGVLLIATAVTAFGSRRPLLAGAFGAAASALILRLVHITPAGDHTILIAGIGLHGLFVNAIQTTMYALGSHVYPTRIRATGIACAAAVGRVGGLVSSLAGAAIIQAGSGFYLVYLAIMMTGAFVGLAIVRSHYPGSRTR